MLNPLKLSKIGIGTWGLGGYMKADPNNDDCKQTEAIVYSLKLGMNYLETVYMYAAARAVDILAQAVIKSGVRREDIFLALSVYHNDAQIIEEVEEKVNDFLRKFNTSYLDNLQFPMNVVAHIGLESINYLVRSLIVKKKLRYSGLVNANLEFLKIFYSVLGDTQFPHEVCFNFEIRENELMGITEWAKQKGILNIVYQPLRRNRTAERRWPLLVKLSEKYKRDQNQILLNWIVSKGFYPIVKSTNLYHIHKNLESFNFQISSGDLRMLNTFCVPSYTSPTIDWFCCGNGFEIAQLPDIFDQEYEKQLRNNQNIS